VWSSIDRLTLNHATPRFEESLAVALLASDALLFCNDVVIFDEHGAHSLPVRAGEAADLGRHHQKSLSTSTSIRKSTISPKKKWITRIMASPFKFYQAQISSGIFLGIGTPSEVSSSAREVVIRVPLAAKMIP